jgi:hypothetical protein
MSVGGGRLFGLRQRDGIQGFRAVQDQHVGGIHSTLTDG